jgi:hypothetical protein
MMKIHVQSKDYHGKLKKAQPKYFHQHKGFLPSSSNNYDFMDVKNTHNGPIFNL